MNITELAFTLVPVTDLKKARRFYEEILGLKPTHEFQKGGMGMVEYDLGAATLTLSAGVALYKPQAAGAVAFEMEDFGAAVTELRAQGVRFILEPVETPVCRMAVVADPDGNQLIIHKRKAG